MGSKKIFRINDKYDGLREDLEKFFDSIIERIQNGRLKGKDTHFLPPGAEYIYRGRNNLYKIKFGNLSLVIKDFKTPHIINRHVYTTVRKSKAARSFLNALQMESLGFHTPSPVAYFEYHRATSLIYSAYVSEELTDATEMRHWEDNPEASALLPQFAREMVRLHKAGVYHKDFSPGNILYTSDSMDGYNFYYVDLNRMKFNVSDHHTLMRMFRSINLNADETRRLAMLYAEAAGLDPEKTSEEALLQLYRYLASR